MVVAGNSDALYRNTGNSLNCHDAESRGTPRMMRSVNSPRNLPCQIEHPQIVTTRERYLPVIRAMVCLPVRGIDHTPIAGNHPELDTKRSQQLADSISE